MATSIGAYIYYFYNSTRIVAQMKTLRREVTKQDEILKTLQNEKHGLNKLKRNAEIIRNEWN